MAKRKYNNTLRESNRLETRRKIVEVMVQSMADGADDISMAEVARRCGVALRTVYQHFPNREARIEAIDEWISSQDDPRALVPGSYADIVDYAERAVRFLVANEAVVRAQMAPGLAKSVRAKRKQLHLRALRKALGERCDDASRVREFAALIVTTVRADVVFDLREEHDLSVERIVFLVRAGVSGILHEFEQIE